MFWLRASAVNRCMLFRVLQEPHQLGTRLIDGRGVSHTTTAIKRPRTPSQQHSPSPPCSSALFYSQTMWPHQGSWGKAGCLIGGFRIRIRLIRCYLQYIHSPRDLRSAFQLLSLAESGGHEWVLFSTALSLWCCGLLARFAGESCVLVS